MGNAYLFTYNLETSKCLVNKLYYNSRPFNLNMKFNCYYSTELIEIFIIFMRSGVNNYVDFGGREVERTILDPFRGKIPRRSVGT